MFFALMRIERGIGFGIVIRWDIPVVEWSFGETCGGVYVDVPVEPLHCGGVVY